MGSAEVPLNDADGVDDDSEAPAVGEVESRTGKVLASEHGTRLDKVLVRLAGEFSRSWLQHLVAQGHVAVDGAAARTASRRMRVGEKVQVRLEPTPQSAAFVAQPMALSIVHEDADLLVVDKPAGLVVHPAAGNWSGTLLNGLLAHHAGAARLPRAGIVHRLDKDTSGLMVVAKTPEAAFALSQAIAARTVRREYLALVHGRMAKEQQIDAPIGRDPVSRVRMAVVPGGREARTDVTVQAHADVDGTSISAVHCRLHTGRTHQIRVHLSASGHPLVADSLYGGAPALGMKRQALHAARLGLQHPRSGDSMHFEAPLPVDMAAAWQRVAGPPLGLPAALAGGIG